jgi:hypothetical protein
MLPSAYKSLLVRSRSSIQLLSSCIYVLPLVIPKALVYHHLSHLSPKKLGLTNQFRIYTIDMAKMNFYVNTAIVCYHYYRVAVVRRDAKVCRLERDVLEIAFIPCAMCLTLLGVHNPITATFSRYLDPQRYSSDLRYLTYLFDCLLNIPYEQKFSITTLRRKSLTKIRDVSEIFDIETILERNIRILQYGRPTTLNSRFFKHEPLVIYWKPFNHPQIVNPFALVVDKLSVFAWPQTVGAPLCSRCFLDLTRDAPPGYPKESKQSLVCFSVCFSDEN